MTQVLAVLMTEGLVDLERVTQDGTKIRAQASRRSFCKRQRLEACLQLSRSHLEELDREASQQSSRQEAARRRTKDDQERRIESALQLLTTMEESARGNRSRSAHVSITDPDARFMRHGDSAISPSYNVQLTTDAAQGLVVGVAVSQASNDAKELAPAMDRFRQEYGKYPQQVLADGDFTNHESVVAMHERDIEFVGSFGHRRLRTLPAHGGGKYKTDRFSRDPSTDELRCPEGKRLRFQYIDKKPGKEIRVYIARKEDCHVCPARRACCGESELRQTGRKITIATPATPIRLFDERMATDQAKLIYRQRSRIAEFPNAWIKSKLNMRQFRCRTLAKVKCEAIFAVLTYNCQRYLQLSRAITT